MTLEVTGTSEKGGNSMVFLSTEARRSGSYGKCGAEEIARSSHFSEVPVQIEASWKEALANEFKKPYWKILADFVHAEYRRTPCFPEPKNIFRAFNLTPFSQVRVVILGQDPYHTKGAAMGLAFSTPLGSKTQPSLQNIFKELKADMNIARVNTNLSDWAEQGVFLLNTVLTVEEGLANSHKGRGWENFTDAVITALSEQKEGLIFVLWGNSAASKIPLIDTKKHTIIQSVHPSPFSARNGFFGSKPFSKINAALLKQNKSPIRWA